MKTRIFMTAAVAVIFGVHAIAATPPSTPGLWAQVPPLPTACYAENDAAYEKLAAAHDSIQQDHYRQSDANAAVDEKARGNDMMDVASRMQEEMMRDQAYQATCPAWFGAGGQVQAYLTRYKDFLTEKRIPAGEVRDRQKVDTYEKIYKTPATTYKSVASHEAVEDYIELAQEMYQWRDARPKCPGGKCTV
jgi:hypothetical protein